MKWQGQQKPKLLQRSEVILFLSMLQLVVSLFILSKISH